MGWKKRLGFGCVGFVYEDLGIEIIEFKNGEFLITFLKNKSSDYSGRYEKINYSGKVVQTFEDVQTEIAKVFKDKAFVEKLIVELILERNQLS